MLIRLYVMFRDGSPLRATTERWLALFWKTAGNDVREFPVASDHGVPLMVDK